MFSSLFQSSIFLVLFIIPFINAQVSGYIGYNLNQTGDPNSTVYETDETDTAGNSSTLIPDPDVFLNASVHVGEIDITVQNLTAKINLQAQVLELLNFNAGVDVSIDRVELLIQNVSAQVMLEARLANLVLMIDDVLSSLDLNPVLATLGQDVGQIVNTTVGGLTGSDSSSTTTKRGLAYNLAHNVLYSINDYSGHTHTNRILSQSGSIVDQSLDDDGNVLSSRDVGSFLRDMSYNGYNQTMVLDGKVVHEVQYLYTPYNGLNVVSAIYIDDSGSVVATQVLSEASGGGESTIGN